MKLNPPGWPSNPSDHKLGNPLCSERPGDEVESTWVAQNILSISRFAALSPQDPLSMDTDRVTGFYKCKHLLESCILPTVAEIMFVS